MQTELLKVTGMTCGHCTTIVTRALKEVSGVGNVDVSLSTGEVTVHYGELALAATPTWAAQDDRHQGHHPAGSVSVPAAKASPNKPNAKMACVGMQMQAMHEMHNKMMSAKTPEERNTLMAEQMKVMQDGMNMMKGMSAANMSRMKGDMAAHHPLMEQRMAMMDRLPAAGDATEKQP